MSSDEDICVEDILRVSPDVHIALCKIEGFASVFSPLLTGEQKPVTVGQTDRAPRAAAGGAGADTGGDRGHAEGPGLPDLQGDYQTPGYECWRCGQP